MTDRIPTAAWGAACPCGRHSANTKKPKPLALKDCCGRFFLPAQENQTMPAAPDAEHLMRSRYTAYSLLLRDYVLATWHASTRPSTLELDANTRWLGLEVRDHTVVDDTHSEVEFVARYREQGRGQRMQERSRFVKEEGRWWYVDGDFQT
ncbi:hypothetical protein E8K88_04075 [Lampropedia aestuarii]|uniref:YchJ-like middle NTF2-like domain-containing protein n=1 Tax=Lampropedia aestuarii TaxID=2562762 RepID=A0A4S5BQY0_9BURK|nr:YchJ family metal-binding protein [Lampropedia aestuarii]THJ35184.1 hypothetical protein E8K88_04075 [Lampropedia aestuarii]